MSQYTLTIEGIQGGDQFIETICLGWDLIRRRFFLNTTGYYSVDYDTETFEELIVLVKQRNKLVGISGLGMLGRQLRAFQGLVEEDQKNGVGHGDVIDSVAHDITERRLLL